VKNSLPLPAGDLEGLHCVVGHSRGTSLSPGSSHVACAQHPQPPSPAVALRAGGMLVPHSQPLLGFGVTGQDRGDTGAPLELALGGQLRRMMQMLKV